MHGRVGALVCLGLVCRLLARNWTSAIGTTVLAIIPALLLLHNLPETQPLKNLRSPFNGRFTIDSSKVLPSGARRLEARGSIGGRVFRALLSSPDLPWAAAFAPGKNVRLSVDLEAIPDGPRPWEYSAYLRRRGFAATGRIKENSELGHREAMELSKRQDFVETLHQITGGREPAAIALAATLGDESLLSDSLRNIFLDSSLMHQLVVSGYQVTLFWVLASTVIRLLLRVFPHRVWKLGLDTPVNVLSFAAVLSYVFLLDDDVPATRAWMALAIVVVGRFLGRSLHPLRTLGVLAYVVWILFPGSVFEMSFQLTFAALLGLHLGTEWASGRSVVASWFLVHCGPILLTTPILLLWTGRVCPLALFFNLFFGTVFSVIFICGGGLSLVALWLNLPGAVSLLNCQRLAGEIFLRILRSVVEMAGMAGLGPVELSSSASRVLAGALFILTVFLYRKGAGNVVADESSFSCYKNPPP